MRNFRADWDWLIVGCLSSRCNTDLAEYCLLRYGVLAAAFPMRFAFNFIEICL